MLHGKDIWVRPSRKCSQPSRGALSVCTLGVVIGCALPEMRMVGGNGGSTGAIGNTGASTGAGVGGTRSSSNAKSSAGEGSAGKSTQSIGVAGAAGSTAPPINTMTGGMPTAGNANSGIARGGAAGGGVITAGTSATVSVGSGGKPTTGTFAMGTIPIAGATAKGGTVGNGGTPATGGAAIGPGVGGKSSTGGTTAKETIPSTGIPYVPVNTPSCNGLSTKCQNESCCTSIKLPGGTYPMGRSIQQSAPDYYDQGFDTETPEHSATVASFALDKYEVTVGRFRRFVNTYDEWHKTNPSEGAGANPRTADTGWGQSWSAASDDLPADKTELTNALKFNEAYQTWTDEIGTNEAYPINCVDWFMAFAFCIWDGGRLPTEAEWEYAAAAGSQNRLYPWGKEAPDSNRANCSFGEGSPASTSRMEVGSKLATGGAGYFNHADLAGSVSEWVFDWFLGNYYGTDEVPVPCGNCANVTPTGGPAGDPPTRVVRGGSWYGDSNITGFGLRAASRSLAKPIRRDNGLGFRCARTLP